MVTIGILIRRNLRVFWRDRLTVFFTILGPLIVFVLFGVFLRKQTAQLIQSGVPGSSDADAYGMCDAWVFASVVSLSCFTGSLGMLMAFVDDRTTGRFSDYLVTPVKRPQLAISYVISTLIVSFAISSIFLVFSQLWALGFSDALMSPVQILQGLAAIFLSCFIFSAMNMFIVTFLGSQGAMGGYSITMGTAMGFVAYCFVTPQGLAAWVNNSLALLPFAETASLIRHPMMRPATDRIISVLPTQDLQDQARDVLMNNLAVTLTMDGHELSVWLIVTILVTLALIFAVLVGFRMDRVIH